jgi:hypothetical protein
MNSSPSRCSASPRLRPEADQFAPGYAAVNDFSHQIIGTLIDRESYFTTTE